MKTFITSLFLSVLTLQTSFAQDDVYDSSYNAGDYNNSPNNNSAAGDNRYYNNPSDNSSSYTDEKGNTYVTNNYYNHYLNDDYDYYYSSRIRRFHRPVINYNYYDDYYVNRYWYNRYDPWGSIYDPIDSYWDWHFRPVIIVHGGWGNIYYGASWYNCWSWYNPWGYGRAWNNGWHHGWRNRSGWYGRGGWGSPYWNGFYDGYYSHNHHNGNWYSSSNPNSGTYYNGPRRNTVRVTEVATNSGFVKPNFTTSGKPRNTENISTPKPNNSSNTPKKPIFESRPNTNTNPKGNVSTEINESRPNTESRPNFDRPSKNPVENKPTENPAPKPLNNHQDKPKFDVDRFENRPSNNDSRPSNDRPKFNHNNDRFQDKPSNNFQKNERSGGNKPTFRK